MKVGIKLGKVKKLWIGWCISHRVVAEPPASNRVKRKYNLMLRFPDIFPKKMKKIRTANMYRQQDRMEIKITYHITLFFDHSTYFYIYFSDFISTLPCICLG